MRSAGEGCRGSGQAAVNHGLPVEKLLGGPRQALELNPWSVLLESPPKDAASFPLSRCAARVLWSKPTSSHQPYQLVTVLPGRPSCNFGFKVSLRHPHHKSHLWEAKARPPDRWNRDPASPSPTPLPRTDPRRRGREGGGGAGGRACLG